MGLDEIIKQKYNSGYQGLGGGETGELLFNEYKVAILQDEELWG